MDAKENAPPGDATPDDALDDHTGAANASPPSSDARTNGVPAPRRPIANSLFRPWVFLVLLLACHALFLLGRFAPAIATPDANGYWAQGTLLSDEGRTWFKPETDPQYIGIHWLVTPDGRYFSRYPPGLPVLVGLVYRLFGLKACLLVNPALAILSLIGFYCLVRCLLSPGWALAGALLLAMNPVFNRHALSCDSHMAVTCLLAWGCCLLLRWSEHGRLGQIFAAGLLLGCVPAVRYPEALYALGVGAFLLLHWRSRPKIWTHYAAAVAGAAVPLLPLMARNQLAFGAFWRTAYSLTNEQTGFGWDFFRLHFVNYVRQLHGDGVGLLFPFGLVGIVTMCGVRGRRPVGWLFTLVAAPITLLYMAYYWAPQHHAAATMRFVLPTFICYLAAGLWVLALFTARASARLRAAIVVTVLLFQAIWGGFNSIVETRLVQYPKQALATVTDALRQHTRDGDVVIAHPQILQHLDFVRRWRLVDPMVMRDRPGLRKLMERKRDPDTPAPMQLEKHDIQAGKYKGMRPFGRERAVAWDVSTWAGDRKVYYVGSERDIERMAGFYFNQRNFRVIARVPLPEPPAPDEPEGMMGAGFRRHPPDDVGRPRPTQEHGKPESPDAAPRPDKPGRPGFGPGGRGPRKPGGNRALARWAFLTKEKELVIAEWTWRPTPRRQREVAPGTAGAGEL